MSQLFGFQINRKDKDRGQSPVPPNAEDGIAVAAGGYFGTYVETDAQARNDIGREEQKREYGIIRASPNGFEEFDGYRGVLRL